MSFKNVDRKEEELPVEMITSDEKGFVILQTKKEKEWIESDTYVSLESYQ